MTVGTGTSSDPGNQGLPRYTSRLRVVRLPTASSSSCSTPAQRSLEQCATQPGRCLTWVSARRSAREHADILFGCNLRDELGTWRINVFPTLV
ncbi:hypothetical protein PYCCODRAFT_1142432 [Trametes coccinea BRFM310]|uniref:Uncharacterized protein n=1 Tax=Trametes coccinea (strain BRFM310) TaxID=1353009 RepID=A0A1Y2I617_TRAC3|nr:hypothetical protein PYCCODRAFT_1265846 [Trametes coccinea BRFM310]OSC97406.1 hypothetical protein PYCCODRAFT_1142432 [Trametes coccinea BRFM310]